MNREQMIEKAAVAITNYLDPVREKKHNGQWDEFDYGQAQAVVDAILPQITTVEELDDLYLSGDRRTVLIDSRGYPHRIGLIAAEVVERYGPLTVVWRPE